LVVSQFIYDLVDLAVLTNYARSYDNEVLRPQAQFVLDEYLPNQEEIDLEYKVRKGTLLDVDVATVRSWDTPTVLTGRQGVSQIKGSMVPISRGIMLGEEETLRVRRLLNATNDPLIQQIYADTELMTRSVAARIEMARGDVIDDGKFTITAENGLTMEADFGRSGWASPTAGTLWTNSNATPLSDMLGWQETYITNNGIEPGEIILSRARVLGLGLNAEIRSYAAANGTTPARVNFATLGDILSYEGLPPIRVYDGVFRVEGTATRVLKQNKAYIMPPKGEPLGNTFYGPTAEAIVLAEKGLIASTATPGIAAVVLYQEHPVQTTTLATAVTMPVMPNPNLVMDAIVA
jgi:hypothetical protein